MGNPASAAPPSNDRESGAIAIGALPFTSQDTMQATASEPRLCPTRASVFYSFTSSVTQRVQVSTHVRPGFGDGAHVLRVRERRFNEFIEDDTRPDEIVLRVRRSGSVPYGVLLSMMFTDPGGKAGIGFSQIFPSPFLSTVSPKSFVLAETKRKSLGHPPTAGFAMACPIPGPAIDATIASETIDRFMVRRFISRYLPVVRAW